MVAQPHRRGAVVPVAATVVRTFLLPRRTVRARLPAGFAMLRLPRRRGLATLLPLRPALATRPLGPRLAGGGRPGLLPDRGLLGARRPVLARLAARAAGTFRCPAAAAAAAPATAPAGDAELAVLTNLAQQLLSSNEFLYVD